MAEHQITERIRFEETDMLDVRDVAAYFDVSPRTVERMPIPWVYLTKRERRILFRNLLAWVASRQVAA